MKKKQSFLILSVILSIMLLECQNNKMPVENELNVSTNSTLHKVIADARLYIYVEKKGYGTWPAGQTVKVHRVTNEWKELEATWYNRLTSTKWDNPGGDIAALDSPSNILTPNDSSGGYWLSTSITDIIEAWKSGLPNYGIILEQGATSPYLKYRSRNYDDTNDEYAPFVKITYDDGSEDIVTTEDTYIWKIAPETNNGSSAYLYTGIVGKRLEDGTAIYGEKRSLLKFDIEIDKGCTHTQGYWKTHAKKCRKRYDHTWDLLSDGPSTKFFSSGKTYIQVLWKTPRGGNEYYILAHQFIAAELNQLSGASIPTNVKEAFNKAKNLFANIETADRHEWLTLAELLNDYNSGLIGPGHCDGCHNKWHKKRNNNRRKCKP